MSSETADLVELWEQLPAARRAEVANFVRFLLKCEGDARWKALIADPKPRPKLEAFLSESAADPPEPLDLSRL